MILLCVAFAVPALLISACATALLIRLGNRFKTFDTAPMEGQVKAEQRPVPNTGGIAITAAIVLPILAVLAAAHTGSVSEDAPRLFLEAQAHFEGIRDKTPLALALVGCLVALHILGLVDDRRPLPWLPKLAVMLALPALLATFTDTRLLTMLDAHAGGTWLSILVTILWFAAVTNAMNFMDNMDGLSAGTAIAAALAFLASALLSEQWFVAAALATLIGACRGFLFFNFPYKRNARARIYMGDSGSLVIGFMLAFLTTRTTYYADAAESPNWYAALMPLIVLAIPLYDLVSVCLIRLRQGKSPFVGDLQHFSHRLVRRGFTPRTAVAIIWMLTAITAISGVALHAVEPWQASLIALQTALVLIMIAFMERASSEP